MGAVTQFQLKMGLTHGEALPSVVTIEEGKQRADAQIAMGY